MTLGASLIIIIIFHIWLMRGSMIIELISPALSPSTLFIGEMIKKY